ncbi:MAG: subfamily B ATP-binding cassette protein MsbA [Polaribacter sp.]
MTTNATDTKPTDDKPTGVKAYRALLSLAFEHKTYFGMAVIAMIVFAGTEAAFAYIMKPMLDEGFIGGDPFIIKMIPIAIILIFLVRMVTIFTRIYCMDYIGRNVINSLRQTMFDKLITMTSTEYDQSSSGAILTRFSFDVERVATSVSSALTVFIQDTLRIIVLLGYMFWLNWQLTCVFLLAGPIIFLVVVKLTGRFRRLSKSIQSSMGDVSMIAQEVIDSNRIVKIFGGVDFERKKFAEINQNNLKLHLKLSVAKAVSVPFVQFIISIAFAAIVAFATSESMRGIITTGDFVSFIIAMTMVLVPMRVLSSINASIQEGIAAGESIFAFTASESEEDTGKIRLDRTKGQLSFKNIALKYHNNNELVLDNISFNVAPNQTIAIVGRSGSGKSSLVNLIPRLYELDGGEILLDGERIQDYKLKDLRRQIAYVGQDVRLFNDTIRNNIAYGLSDAVSDEQIIEAAKQAFAWEFIETLPEVLNTKVGERGVLLSGGQRQRIAIARALLKDAPILILDEATSALDTESERYIQNAIENLMTNRTTLVIAHRLSTIEHADRILVLDQGKLLEQGDHHGLLELNGTYAKLHSMQFRDIDASVTELTGITNQPEIQSITLDKSVMSHWMMASTQRRQGWWLWSINPLAIALMPLSLLYYLLSRVRRLCYHIGLLSSTRLPVTTIIVGNVTLGGNGKTPVVIALFRLLKDKGYQPAIVTRGYKSGNEDKVQILSGGQINIGAGDEANMISEICHCPVGVGSNRIESAEQILAQFPDTNIILSDDGLQHYGLKRDIEIVVCRLVAFGNGLMIPAGPLRETRRRLDKADITINRDGNQIVESLNEVWNLNDPSNKVHITQFKGRQVHALAGIGFPETFFASLVQVGIDPIAHEFPDHYAFTPSDLELKPDLPILVTHKDAVKLKGVSNHNIWVVPLGIDFSTDLENEILQLLETKHHG